MAHSQLSEILIIDKDFHDGLAANGSRSISLEFGQAAWIPLVPIAKTPQPLRMCGVKETGALLLIGPSR